MALLSVGSTAYLNKDDTCERFLSKHYANLTATAAIAQTLNLAGHLARTDRSGHTTFSIFLDVEFRFLENRKTLVPPERAGITHALTYGLANAL